MEWLWQKQLREGLKTAEDLLEYGLIARKELGAYQRLLKRYRLGIPRPYADLIDPHNPRCPIRLQCVPQLFEGEDREGWQADPLEDLNHQPVPRITHRYSDRVLFHLTGLCSMYCRYCFRKSLLNEKREDLFSGGFTPALEYLRSHVEIREVIFSGGDPLLVTDSVLESVLNPLQALSHIKRVRFHTRVPVTLPSRVTSSFVDLLVRFSRPTMVVVHFNHPKELTSSSHDAIAKLRSAGVALMNQSVLLKGVNDSIEVLSELSERLFEKGVLPYYLHQLDRASGTGHFEVPLEEGRQLYNGLRERLPGYLVPRYVVEDPTRPFKTPAMELTPPRPRLRERYLQSSPSLRPSQAPAPYHHQSDGSDLQQSARPPRPPV